jgi:AGZA family xanthine/uracil permease-like MFS transporter
VFVATCLIAAFGTLVMGLFANYPIALAPGMGLNAYFAYVVVGGMGYSWQVALGAVFISGCLFLAVTVLRLREWIIRGIPHSLRVAITVGIGMFLALIALKSAGIVAPSKATFVTLGDVHQAPVLLAVAGFILIVVLDQFRVRGAILWGIVAVTLLSFFVAGNRFNGVFAAPPSIAPTFLQLDVKGALAGGVLNVVLVFFLVELFDATGTLMGVARRAGLLKDGKMDRMNKALLADSGAIFAGSLLGTSSTTAYIESATGVQAGGRTGLTAVTVAGLFLACLFIAPLAGAVPPYATAPVLIVIGVAMFQTVVRVPFDRVAVGLPAFATLVLIPLTFSITQGILWGFILHVALHVVTGRRRDLAPGVLALAAVSVALLVLEHSR